jgi:hemerythrin-like domain-containing protein
MPAYTHITPGQAEPREVTMIEIIEVLRQEHRNIEKLLGVLERELSVFVRGDRPDYEVVLAVIDYFKDYPDSCHHPKEDIIVEKFKARDPVAERTSAILKPNIGRARDVCAGSPKRSNAS